MKNKIKKAFTLVELIVVITILSILGTIAFISLQGYSKTARDSVRISDLSNIEKMLGVTLVRTGKVPIPENKVDITASGVLISYQGYAGEQVLSNIGIFNGGKDPLDSTYYTYITNKELTRYQLLGYLEGGEEISLNMFLQSNADITNRYPISKGFELGVMLDSVSNEPIQITGTGVDIVNTSEEYKIHFNNTNEGLIIGTGNILFSKVYSLNESLLSNKDFAKLDESLVGYWDMETIFNSGGIDYLKDFSKYGNHGKCFNGGIINCGSENGPQILQGKGVYFDGIDDYVEVDNSTSLDITSNLTVSVWWYFYDDLEGNTIINKDDITSTGRSWCLYSRNRNHSTFPLSSAFEMHDINAYDGPIESKANIIKKGDFNHIVVTFDNSYNGKIYINGIFGGEKSNNIALKSVLTSIKIGARINPVNSSSSEYNKGIIDEVRIYNRTLSKNEIANLYKLKK